MCNCGCRFAYEYTAAYTIWCNLLLCCLKLCHAILLFGFTEGTCWTFPSINLLENLQCGLGTLLGSHPYCRAWFHPTPLFLHLGRLHLGCHCYPHVHHRCAFERGIWGSQPPGGSPKDVGNGHHPPEPSLAVLPPCCRGLAGVLHSPFLHRSGAKEIPEVQDEMDGSSANTTEYHRAGWGRASWLAIGREAEDVLSEGLAERAERAGFRWMCAILGSSKNIKRRGIMISIALNCILCFERSGSNLYQMIETLRCVDICWYCYHSFSLNYVRFYKSPHIFAYDSMLKISYICKLISSNDLWIPNTT